MATKNVEDFYPLSPMQQGMLFHSLYAPESGVYVEQMSCTLCGGLNVPAFEQAWQQVVDRHSILRTSFVTQGLKEPVQVVHRRVSLPIERQDWRGLPQAEQAARLDAFLQAEQQRGFVLSEAPLMRLAIMQIAEDAHEFVWCHHHALLDGWSVPMLLQEVLALYEAIRQGQVLRLDPRRPYRDYIVWLKRQDMNQAEAFWRQTLQGLAAPTPFVVDHPLSEPDAPERYDEQAIQLSAETTALLQTCARRNQLTFNTLVQGAWALLLSRYSGEQDVVFGATVSGRPPDLTGAETMLGLFINTLPVRARVLDDMPIIEWLKLLQSRTTEMRQYEYSPLVQIQGWSQVPRGTPLFENILVFENYPLDTVMQQHEGSLRIENIRSFERTNYPLTAVAGADQQLMLKLLYDCRRFDQDTITRMLGHLRTILTGIASAPRQLVEQVPLLTRAEEHQLLVEWNDTAAVYSSGRCAHELFEAQVQQCPHVVAVTCGPESLTYDELNRRANQLAHYLRRLNVGPEGRVGICVERSIEMIVGLMGVLKAGGAYVPLDPTYPTERLAFMLQDSQVPVLLTQARLVEQLPQHSAQAVRLDVDWDIIARECDDNLISGAMPDNLAYIIYTSGSTGRPKGTLLQHRGLVNLIHVLSRVFDIQATSRVLQFASLSFDASVAEILPTLSAGAVLCLARQEILLSVPDLTRLLRDQSITLVTLPPSLLTVLSPEGLPALQTVISAGESCPPAIVTRWAHGRRLINGYGPTEATVAASYYMVEESPDEVPHVPIGRPIPNTQIYLLDAHLRLVPISVPGELHIGGVSLARGYLNRPELTQEKFISNPFASTDASREGSTSHPGHLFRRLYKTGDLARYRPDGNIEFLGRIDHQVKIRGFRIELGEIEASLGQHPAVQDAVVLDREDEPGDKRLVAYFVPINKRQKSEAPLAGELRAFLQERLPGYMIPSAFVTLDTWPLLPNGKVDRRALPAPDGARLDVGKTFIAPRDTLEMQLAQICEEVLNVRPVGVTDSFFELGGHSLLAVRLIGRIQQQLGRQVSLATLFQGPTVGQLASFIRSLSTDGVSAWSPLVPIQPHGSGQPLFFVHPSGGSVHWYTDLASALGEGQPFYGLQAQGMDGDAPLDTRIQDMAARYVQAILAFQPQGPYLLGSWSMGVSVAFEMAQQLQAQGQPVALLAVLDQGPILPGQEPEDDAAYLVDVFGKELPLSVEHLRQLDPQERLAHVWREALKSDWLYPDVTLDQFSHFVRTLRTHTEAWRHYTPQPYAGQITLFRAKEQPEHAALEPDMGWGRFALGGVEIHHVPGDHLSMIHEPHVQILAERLKQCLDQAQPECAQQTANHAPVRS